MTQPGQVAAVAAGAKDATAKKNRELTRRLTQLEGQMAQVLARLAKGGL